MLVDETIAAIASSHEGGGLRGIVRISGPQVRDCLTGFFHAEPHDEDGAAQASDWTACRHPTRFPGHIDLPTLGKVPCTLCFWPTDRSYTGQPSAELHTYGAAPLLEAVVEAACRHGARLARPGEFTMRSFLAGRLDLAQAEAVLGVIDAVDRRELDTALNQLAGGLTQPLSQLRDELLNLCADLEAGLDFTDEDIEFVSAAQVQHSLQQAMQLIATTESQMQSRGSADQLPRVVLRGEPNVGKSSLWNALVPAATALVADQAGTTRDYLVGTVQLPNARFQVVDTAGVEGAGRNQLAATMDGLAQQQADGAALVLLCIDASRPLTTWEQQQLNASPAVPRLVVLTKCDLPRGGADLQHVTEPQFEISGLHASEAASGLHDLLSACEQHLASVGQESTVVGTTALRCRESLRLARDACQRAWEVSVAEMGDELVAAELRLALEQLGLVVGVIYTDDILDRVFSRFCIGK